MFGVVAVVAPLPAEGEDETATRSLGGTRETCPAADVATRHVRATGSPSWAVTTLAQSRSRVCCFCLFLVFFVC